MYQQKKNGNVSVEWIVNIARTAQMQGRYKNPMAFNKQQPPTERSKSSMNNL